MNARSMTLAELEQLAASLEEGGASGLSDSDLAFVGRVLEVFEEALKTVQRKVDSETLERLNAREADVIASNGSSITRTWKNEYHTNLDALVEGVIKLDADFAQEAFKFVPAKRPDVIPAHWELVGNIAKVQNWVKKLGLSGERVALEEAIGQKQVRPSITYKAINPETGEVF